MDFQMTIDFLDSRYVFFFSCIDSVGDEMSQFLAGIDEFFRYCVPTDTKTLPSLSLR